MLLMETAYTRGRHPRDTSARPVHRRRAGPAGFFMFASVRSRCCLVVTLCMAMSDASAQSVFDASRLGSVPVAKSVRTVREMRYRELVPQRYDFSCGTAALATLLQYGYGYQDLSETELIRRMLVGADPAKVIKNGFSMLDMKRYVESIGLRGFGFRIQPDALYRLKMPVVTLVDVKGYKHFVLIKGAEAGRVFVADPALGHRVVPEHDFARGWNGIVFAVIADRPLRTDSYLLGNRHSPALKRRVDALDSATMPAPVVEFGLTPADLF